MDLSYNAVPNLSVLDDKVVNWKAEQKAQKRRAEVGPDAPDPSLPRVWAVYRWSVKHWILAGFARYPHMSKRRIARIRRRFDVPERGYLIVMDLFEAAKTGGPSNPPDMSLRKPARPWSVPTPYLVKGTKRTVRRRLEEPTLPARLTQKVQKARFIVIGELADKRHHPIPTYLGLLFSETLAAARKEAQKLFKSLYGRLHVFSLKDLSKSLRRRIRKGRLHAGVTVIQGLVHA